MILRDTNIQRALKSRQRGWVLNPFRFGGANPYDNATFLNNFESMSGSDVVSEVGPNIGISGTNALDTSVKKWGSSSLRIDPSQPATTMGTNITQNLTGRAWRWQFWLRRDANVSNQVLIDFLQGGTNRGLRIFPSTATAGNGYQTNPAPNSGTGGSGTLANSIITNSPINTWIHVAIEQRPGMGIKLFDSTNGNSAKNILTTNPTTTFLDSSFLRLSLESLAGLTYYVDSMEFKTYAPEDAYLLYQVSGYVEPVAPFPSSNVGAWPGSTWKPIRLPLALHFSNESTASPTTGNVQTLQDLTAHSFIAQSGASWRPLLVASGLNGLRTVRFDGTNDFLETWTSQFMSAGYGALFVVFKKTALDGSPTEKPLFYVSTASGATTARFYVSVGDTTNQNRLRLATRRLDADSVSLLSADTLADTNFHMALFVMDWANATGSIYFDGNSPTSGAMGTSGVTSSGAAAGPPTVGKTGGSVYGDVEIAELLTYQYTALSAGDIDKLFGYAAHKWGLTGNLPGGHPYKSVAP